MNVSYDGDCYLLLPVRDFLYPRPVPKFQVQQLHIIARGLWAKPPAGVPNPARIRWDVRKRRRQMSPRPMVFLSRAECPSCLLSQFFLGDGGGRFSFDRRPPGAGELLSLFPPLSIAIAPSALTVLAPSAANFGPPREGSMFAFSTVSRPPRAAGASGVEGAPTCESRTTPRPRARPSYENRLARQCAAHFFARFHRCQTALTPVTSSIWRFSSLEPSTFGSALALGFREPGGSTYSWSCCCKQPLEIQKS